MLFASFMLRELIDVINTRLARKAYNKLSFGAAFCGMNEIYFFIPKPNFHVRPN